MKLVRIQHIRCNEFDEAEYIWAPTIYSDAEISQIISETVNEMLADAAKVDEAPEKPSYATPYSKYPNLTVREVDAIQRDLKAKWAIWMKDNSKLTRSLEDRLRARGFVALWDDNPEVLDIHADWGHAHGLDLNYGKRKKTDD